MHLCAKPRVLKPMDSFVSWLSFLVDAPLDWGGTGAIYHRAGRALVRMVDVWKQSGVILTPICTETGV